MDQANEPESPWKSFFHGLLSGLSLGILYALLNQWFGVAEPQRNIASTEESDTQLVQK